MVILNTINNLKERPRDERKAIAKVAAIVIIVVIFVVWAVLFFKKIQNVGPIEINVESTEESTETSTTQ